MSDYAKAATCKACGREAVIVYAEDGHWPIEAYHPAVVLREAIDKGEPRCPVLLRMDCPCEHYSHRIPIDEAEVTG